LLAAMLARDAPARADIVMPATEACPTGSYAQPSHNGPYCTPATCGDDSGCERFFDDDRVEAPAKLAKEPMVCAVHPLCIRKDMVSAGRFHPIRKVERESVVGNCSPSGGCPQGSRCSKQKACIPRRIAGDAGTPPPPRPTDAGAAPTNDASADRVDIPVDVPPAATSSAAADAAPPPTEATPDATAAPVPPPAASSCGRCAAGEPGNASTTPITFGLAALVVALRRRRRHG
jgi:MYXO-CTERM domain-containing protein